MNHRLAAPVLALTLLALTATPAGAQLSDTPAPWTPRFVGPVTTPDNIAVFALAKTGGTVYVGGKFDRAQQPDGSLAHRDNLLAFTHGTGRVLPLDVAGLNAPVRALAVKAGWLYVGGDFTGYLKRVNAVTGRSDPGFRPRLDGQVTDLTWHKSRLIVAGKFKGHLRAVRPSTGERTPYLGLGIRGVTAANAGPTSVLDVDVFHRNKLAVIGNFTRVGGRHQERAFLAHLGKRRASLTSWHYSKLDERCNPNLRPTAVRKVDGRGSAFYIAASGGRSQPVTERTVCDAVAKFRLGRNAPLWISRTYPKPTGEGDGDTLTSVLATADAVIVQGHQRFLDRDTSNVDTASMVERSGIGALNPRTGNALPWNPGKDRGVGGTPMLHTGWGLYVGSDTILFAGQPRERLAYLPVLP